jgi:hypothetical protein
LAANFIQLPPNSTGLKVDTNELVVGANTVERENISIADPTTAANIAGVTSGGALKVDASATTQPVSGTVSVTSFANPLPVTLTSTTVTGTVAENLTQVAGTSLGATAVVNYGTTPAAVVVPAVNAFVTNTPAVTLTSTTITGTVAENLTQVAGTNLGATAVTNFGTAPAAAAVLGVNASLFTGTTAISNTTAGIPDFNLKNVGNATLSLGQQVAGSSVPVVLPAAQITTLTPLSTVTANQGTAAVVTAPWPVYEGQIAESTTAWTSATGANTALTVTVTGYSTVAVSLNQTTTLTGGAVTFEVSDTIAGTNWYTVAGAQTNAGGTGATVNFQASTNAAYMISVAGWVQFRARLSTVISGTGTVNVGIIAQAGGSTPVSAIGVGSVGLLSGVQNIGKIDILGNTGVALDVATNAAAPANQLWTVSSPTTAAGGAVPSVDTQATFGVQNVKASAGSVYGVSLSNPNASNCWLQFYNTAGTPTLGTSVIWAVVVGTSGVLNISPGSLALQRFATGIGVGSATTPTGSTACGTALAGTIFFA